MGYVREIVQSGLSVADQAAGVYVEKARAVAAARAPEQTQKLESLVGTCCARAMPLVDQVDAKVDSTLASVSEQYQAKKDQVSEQYQAKKDLAQAQLDRATEQYKEKKDLAQAQLDRARRTSKADLQATLQEALPYAKTRAQDTYTKTKAQVQQTTEAKIQEVRTTCTETYQKSKDYASEQYEAKKELVRRRSTEAKQKYETNKDMVFTKLDQTKAVAKSQATKVQAVLVEGSLAELSAVKGVLTRVEGTRYQAASLRLVGAADLVLQKSRAVLPAALPRSLGELQSFLPESVAHTIRTVEAPLLEKLQAAKDRAAGVAGQASGIYTDARAELVAKAQAAAAKMAEAKDSLGCSRRAQVAVSQAAAPTAKALVKVFGEEAVASGYAKGLALAARLPAPVAEWIAQVESLD